MILTNNFYYDKWQNIKKRKMLLKKLPLSYEEIWHFNNFKLLNDINHSSLIKMKNFCSTNDTHKIVIDGFNLIKLNIDNKIIYSNNDNCYFFNELKKFIKGNFFDQQYQILQNYSHVKGGGKIKISKSLKKKLEIIVLNGNKYTTILDINPHVRINLVEKFYSLQSNYINYIIKIKLNNYSKINHVKIGFFKKKVYFLYNTNITMFGSSSYSRYALNFDTFLYREFTRSILISRKSNISIFSSIYVYIYISTYEPLYVYMFIYVEVLFLQSFIVIIY